MSLQVSGANARAFAPCAVTMVEQVSGHYKACPYCFGVPRPSRSSTGCVPPHELPAQAPDARVRNHVLQNVTTIAPCDHGSARVSLPRCSRGHGPPLASRPGPGRGGLAWRLAGPILVGPFRLHLAVCILCGTLAPTVVSHRAGLAHHCIITAQRPVRRQVDGLLGCKPPEVSPQKPCGASLKLHGLLGVR